MESIVKKVNFTGLINTYIIYVHKYCNSHYSFCVLEGKFTLIRIKYGELMCQFGVCYSNISNLYMYKHGNRLIGYLTFISVIGNLDTTHRLISYSVEVHSTSI